MREIEINLAVAERMPPCDETSNLTIYRLVQEGLTNVFQHADATAVDISIGQALDEEAPPGHSGPRRGASSVLSVCRQRAVVCPEG